MRRKSAVLILVVSGVIATLMMPLVISPLLNVGVAGASPGTVVSVIFPNGTNSSIGEYNVYEEYTVNITATNVTDLYSWQAGMTFNPDVIECLNVTEGPFLATGGFTIWTEGTINNTSGTITPYSCTLLGMELPGVTGSGTLAYATFRVKDYGNSTLHLTNVTLLNSTFSAIPTTVVDGYFELPPPLQKCVVDFTESPPPYYVNDTVTFNATTVTPAFNGTHSIYPSIYEWNFTDPAQTAHMKNETATTINFTFDMAGNWTATLRAFCNDTALIDAGLAWSEPIFYVKTIWPLYNETETDLAIHAGDIRILDLSGRPDFYEPGDNIKIEAIVRNVGKGEVKNVEVRFIEVKDGKEVKDRSVTLTIFETIPEGGFRKVSVTTRHLDFTHDVKVVVDPKNKIVEKSEGNNWDITLPITGWIKDSAGKPLPNVKVDFYQKNAGSWSYRYGIFADDKGKYRFFTNLERIVWVMGGVESKVTASLVYSPDRHLEPSDRVKLRLYDDASWGTGAGLRSPRPPEISHSKTRDRMKKTDDWRADIRFPESLKTGTTTYLTLVDVYKYWNAKVVGGVRLAPAGTVYVEVGDVDADAVRNAGFRTSYRHGNIIHLWQGHVNEQDLTLRSIAAHEYGHIIAGRWRFDAAGGRADLFFRDNIANYFSSLSRQDRRFRAPPPVLPYRNLDLANRAQIASLPVLARRLFRLAGVFWTLDNGGRKDDVITTLSRHGANINTPRDFYQYYKGIDTTRTANQIRTIFREYGFNVGGWPADPNMFTGYYHDYKVDLDNDSIAELLNIDVGLNITTANNYYIYGFLQDSGMEEYRYCFALNHSFLNAGIQKVTISFVGESIFGKRLNGSYVLSAIYISTNETVLDFRINAYNTSVYSFTEFQRPDAYTTGSFYDFGRDTDGDSLFNYLIIDIELNVSKPGFYIIEGSLYDSSNNSINGAVNYTYLENGTQTVHLYFDGKAIYANSMNGPYTLRDIVVYNSTGDGGFIEYLTFNTSSYAFASFQRPNTTFTGFISDFRTDINGDGLHEYLTINLDINVTSAGYISISGRLYNSTGYVITSLDNYTYYDAGIQTAQLNFDGIAIRSSRMDGPYYVEIRLFNENGTFIGRINYTTLAYNYTQFQPSPEDYFNITYSDQGTDTNANGLFNYLTINLNTTSLRSDQYIIEGYLYGSSFIGYAFNTSDISDQPSIIQLNFDWRDLRRTKAMNKTYNLTLRIFDNMTLIAELQNVYNTSAYDYLDFEVLPADFNDVYSDHGTDTNNNTFYDYLTVNVEVHVITAGNYTITGILHDSHGNLMDHALNSTYLNANNQTVALNFHGPTIHKHGVNGTYQLSLNLYDENYTEIDHRYQGYTTTPYNFTDFEPLLAEFSLVTLYKVRLDVDYWFNTGANLTVMFYTYDDVYQANTTVWTDSTPTHVIFSINVSHPLGLPVEKATLVLTDENGTIIQTVTSFLVHRTQIMNRLVDLDIDWIIASPTERSTIFQEIVAIDTQWPYAPP